jgi:hypothetical protein
VTSVQAALTDGAVRPQRGTFQIGDEAIAMANAPHDAVHAVARTPEYPGAVRQRPDILPAQRAHLPGRSRSDEKRNPHFVVSTLTTR